MTREDIIRMAREAGAGVSTSAIPLEHPWVFLPEELERFAVLVAAEEREACAKVCEAEAEGQYDNMDIPLTIAADLIRARGETSSRGQT